MGVFNVTSVAELPKGEYFAILYPTSITVPGDERSRTNPGHGYPEHREDYWRIEVYAGETQWKEQIHKLATAEGFHRQPYQAVRITPARVITSVVVDVR